MSVERKPVRFARDTMLTVGVQLLGLVLSTAISVVLARGLGPSAKGAFTIATLVASLVVTFSNFGFGAATVYHAARDRYATRAIFQTNNSITLLLSSLGMALAAGAVLGLQRWVYPDQPRLFLLLALLLVPGQLHQSLVSSLLLGRLWIQAKNAIGLAHTLLYLVLLSVAVLGLEAGAEGALVANVLAVSIVALGLHFAVRRRLGGRSFGFDRAYAVDARDYGLRCYAANVIGFLNYRVEVFLMGAMLSTAAVGQYSIAVGLAERLWMVSHAASMIVLPMVASAKDDRERNRFTPFVARNILWLTVAGAGLVGIVSPWLIPLLYGEDFRPAIRLLQLLLPGIVAIGASRVLANDIAGRGRPGLNTLIGGLGLVVQVLLNAYLIRNHGAEGAAVATSLTYVLMLVLTLGVFMRLSGEPARRVLLPQRADLPRYRRLFRRLLGRLRPRGRRS